MPTNELWLAQVGFVDDDHRHPPVQDLLECGMTVSDGEDQVPVDRGGRDSGVGDRSADGDR